MHSNLCFCTVVAVNGLVGSAISGLPTLYWIGGCSLLTLRVILCPLQFRMLELLSSQTQVLYMLPCNGAADSIYPGGQLADTKLKESRLDYKYRKSTTEICTCSEHAV